jgi:hypothetical protein
MDKRGAISRFMSIAFALVIAGVLLYLIYIFGQDMVQAFTAVFQ